MITQYELYELTAVLVGIRMDIKSEHNLCITEAVIDLLTKEDMVMDNCVREALSKLNLNNISYWSYITCRNYNHHNTFFKDKEIQNILLVTFIMLKELLVTKKFEQAYDFVDAVHCLPDIIAEQNGFITRSYLNCHIKIYNDKWNEKFLNDVDKKIVRKKELLYS